ncbi:hypothetical protein [Aridibaculum aurantiacum]|uniref:hypothetical protein n=1 Tax=Aridibaculum aurantiacum TaxID=2810307 RepID=UPI001A9796FC|nr:hypothetical protein [Aridibaculum aurantiacum]
MNYLNIEETKKKKRQFFILYLSTILVMGIIGTAFLIPQPGSKAVDKKISAEENKIKVYPSAQPVQPVEDYSKKVDSLYEALELKNQEIAALEQRLTVASSAKPTTTTNKKDLEEINFLKWALESQSADVIKLKRENTKLKSQVNDLRQYLQ